MSDCQDTPSVLADKVERLAALLKLSKVRDTYVYLSTQSSFYLNLQRTVIYSGAGISTSAGIGQAARSGGKMMKVTRIMTSN